MKFKRITAVLLAVFSVLSFSSCTKDKSKAVMTLDGYKITANMYNYWACSQKGNYIYTYEDIKDKDECWDSEIKDGETVAEYLDKITLETVKENLVAIKLFADFGLKLTDSEVKSVRDYVDDLIIEYTNGNKNKMNEILSEYGVNLSILEKIYLEETKTTKVFDYLYGEDGTNKLTAEDFEKYYQDTYVHFQMIYINNKYEYKLDENGNYVTDDDGVYETEPMGADEKAQKDKKVSEVEAKLAAGEDFYDLYEEYSELTDYKNGYYYAKDTVYSDDVFYSLVKTAMNMKTKDTAKVESETGTCFIYKLDCDKGGWKDKDNKDFFEEFEDNAKESAYREYIKDYMKKIKVDEEKIEAYTVREITPCYSF